MKTASLRSVQTSQAEIADHKIYKTPSLRKRKVHELFERQGPEAAWMLGLKLRLKQGTLRTWFGQWKRNTDETRAR
jgi:hypothetical protein